MPKEKEYRRLPGRGIRRQGIATAGRTRLWQGRDHLLAVDSHWYSEDYKRFYYRDIQAFLIRKTSTSKVGNIILGALGFLPLLAAISYGFQFAQSAGLAIFWGIIAGVFLLCLLINALMGPTCVCRVQTAVQTEELPSLRRLRRTHKVLRHLRPLILEAQGELVPGQVTGATTAASEPAIAAQPAAGETPAASGQNPDLLQPPGAT